MIERPRFDTVEPKRLNALARRRQELDRVEDEPGSNLTIGDSPSIGRCSCHREPQKWRCRFITGQSGAGCCSHNSQRGWGEEGVHWKNECKSPPRLVSALGRTRVTGSSAVLYRHPLSCRNLRRPSTNMGLRDFFRLPKSHRRARSKTRSEIGFTERLSEFELVELRPTGSTPDLGTGPLISPMSGFSNFHGQGLRGMQTTISQVIHLTALFCGMRSIPSQIKPNPFSAKRGVNARYTAL